MCLWFLLAKVDGVWLPELCSFVFLFHYPTLHAPWTDKTKEKGIETIFGLKGWMGLWKTIGQHNAHTKHLHIKRRQSVVLSHDSRNWMQLWQWWLTSSLSPSSWATWSWRLVRRTLICSLRDCSWWETLSSDSDACFIVTDGWIKCSRGESGEAHD